MINSFQTPLSFEIFILEPKSDSIAVNIKRNGEAINTLKEKHGVTIHDTPADLYPAFAASSAKVMREYSAKDAFFKKVADSQKAFAKLTVPYWTKLLGLYYSIGKAADGN